MHENGHEELVARSVKLAAAAQSLKRHSGAAAPFSLAFLTDEDRAPQPHLIARALPRGAAVILRDYRHKDRTSLAAQLKSVCDACGLFLLVGADPDLGKKIGADGQHFPTWYDGPYDEMPGGITTASCHNAADLKSIAALGVHAVLLSPVFPSSSHPGTPSLGADKFLKLAATAPAPVIALGGVTENNAQQLTGPNIAGIAAIGAFLT